MVAEPKQAQLKNMERVVNQINLLGASTITYVNEHVLALNILLK